VVTEGGDLRVKTLKNWAQEVVPDAYKELFLFAALDLDTLTPNELFFSPSWSSISAPSRTSLIEI